MTEEYLSAKIEETHNKNRIELYDSLVEEFEEEFLYSTFGHFVTERLWAAHKRIEELEKARDYWKKKYKEERRG